MKTLLLALIALLPVLAYAQDTVVMNDGTRIPAIVKSIDDHNIRYHRYDNQAGPEYTTGKDKIRMIRYQNGTEDVFGNSSEAATGILIRRGNNIYQNGQRLHSRDIERLYSIDKALAAQYNRGKSTVTGGRLIAGLGFLATSSGILTIPYGPEIRGVRTGLLAFGIAFLFLGLNTSQNGHRRINRTINTYNKVIIEKRRVSFSPVISDQIGIAMHF